MPNLFHVGLVDQWQVICSISCLNETIILWSNHNGQNILLRKVNQPESEAFTWKNETNDINRSFD